MISHQIPKPYLHYFSAPYMLTVGWFCSFPLDCVRARVQGQEVTGSFKRRSAMEIAEHLIRRKGIIGFYSGVTPSIVRAFLVSASRFSAYEVAISLITGQQYHHS
jgi:solute carrier family 25 carnitine/acylcarnitine transporter 20/29